MSWSSSKLEWWAFGPTSFTEMQGEESNSKLGEISLHGKTRDCLRPWDFKERNRSWQGKIEVIAKLSPPKCIKDIRSFLGHAGFYRQFIKDFRRISRPLTNLLSKDVPFDFDDGCFKSWEKLKEELISAPIISVPNWTKPFEIMCDASDLAIGAVVYR